MIKLVSFLIILFSTTLSAQAQRVALLIGNNSYSTPNQLFNPLNDVQMISKKLQNLGFKVILAKNATKFETDKALQKFKIALHKDSVGLFYFAGHGVEIAGTNYLVPVDAKFDSEDILKRSSLDVNKVIRIFKESGNSLNIIILDACRDNPVGDTTKKGLAPFLSPDGLFVAYSAQAGEKAQDGPKDGYSPFAESFAKDILLGNDIEATFKQIRIDVYNKTKAKQRPSTYSEILASFYFVEKSTRGLKRNHAKSRNNTVNFIRHKRFIEPQLVLIKAGKYLKGNNDDFETTPQHEVTITKDFYVGAYEVSFEEYDMFCKETGWVNPSDNAWGRGKHPVINISYIDAKAYVKWLSKKSKKHYRLISEDEWEYIARAGSKYSYGFSDDDAELELYAWYKDNSNNHPHKIGTKKANKFGVYDLLGNVAELTDSSYYSYRSSHYTQKDNSSNMKVVRGGAYFTNFDMLEVYRRVEVDENIHTKSTGFRVVLEK
jgi:formylglycine-generating enzyme required for sulfatase activity